MREEPCLRPGLDPAGDRLLSEALSKEGQIRHGLKVVEGSEEDPVDNKTQQEAYG
jgi:hypothetical protein